MALARHHFDGKQFEIRPQLLAAAGTIAMRDKSSNKQCPFNLKPKIHPTKQSLL